MEIIKLIGLALTASAVCILFKRFFGEYSFLVTAAALLLILIPVLIELRGFADKIQIYAEETGLSLYYIKILIKAAGISIICDFASSFCRDAGNESLSKGVELLSKTAVLLISLPLIEEIINTVIGLLK